MEENTIELVFDEVIMELENDVPDIPVPEESIIAAGTSEADQVESE